MSVSYLESYDTQSSLIEQIVYSMTYAGLLENLGRLTDLGLIAAQSPVTMLVAARIVDRNRIAKSGIGSADIRRALQKYLRTANAVPGVVKALEQALQTATIAERSIV
jgi:hypothetical protein